MILESYLSHSLHTSLPERGWRVWWEALYLRWRWHKNDLDGENPLGFTHYRARQGFAQSWAKIQDPFFWKILRPLLSSSHSTSEKFQWAVWFALLEHQNNVGLDSFSLDSINAWLHYIQDIVEARRTGPGVFAMQHMVSEFGKLINSHWYQTRVLANELLYLDISASDLITTGAILTHETIAFWRTHGHKYSVSKTRDLELLEAICRAPRELNVTRFVSDINDSPLFMETPGLFDLVRALLYESTSLSEDWAHACRCAYYRTTKTSIECVLLSYAMEAIARIEDERIQRPGVLWSLYEALQQCTSTRLDLESLEHADYLF